MNQVQLNKLNRNLYDSTFGLHTIPQIYQKMSKKRIRLNYNQYKHSLHKNGDMLLQSTVVGDQFPTADKLMDSTLDKCISIAANDCGYGGTAEELIVNSFHWWFLKAKSAIS